MPGVLQCRPELLQVLESFQPFASPNNEWLADLATLSNQTKHVHLSIVEISTASWKRWRDEDELAWFSLKKPDGGRYRYFPGIVVGDKHDDLTSYDGPGYFIGLEGIDGELLAFLEESLDGVSKIIDILEAALAGKIVDSTDKS